MAISSIPIAIGFLITTLLTVWFFVRACSPPKQKVIALLLIWLLIQGAIGISGFYKQFEAFPPRFPLLLFPPTLLILFLFFSAKGKRFNQSLSLKILTLLHIIRVPVEIILHQLYVEGSIPVLMTYEGINFDILSGITAPIMYYLVFIKQKISHRGLLIWNIACLALLINIVTQAILSFPSPFQQFAFEQPNIGIADFPMVWLPCCVVPIVLYAHLVAIQRLSAK